MFVIMLLKYILSIY